MPLRIRWFNVSPFDKRSLRLLRIEFSRHEYSDTMLRGYSQLSSEGTCLRGQYVERFDFTTKTEDPIGKIFEMQIVEFEKIDFAFNLDVPVLELRNAPRSVGAFFNSVAQILAFKVAIQPVQVDLSKWLKAVSPHVDTITVCGASIADISLSNTVSARVVVIGTSDVRLLTADFMGKYSHAIVRLQLSGLFRSLPFKCELCSDAKVTIFSGAQEELILVLRKSLLSVQSEGVTFH